MGWENRQYFDFFSSIEALFIVCLFAFPTVIWHVCGHFSPKESSNLFVGLLSSYKLVLGILVLGLLGSGIVTSGLTEWLYCFRWEQTVSNTLGNEFVFLCHPPLGYGTEFLVIPFLMALLLIAFARIGALFFRKLT